MRRRDSFDRHDQENYSGLTGYDEMSTRQVDEQSQKQSFGFAEPVAQAQPQNADLYTRAPQNPHGEILGQQSMFGGVAIASETQNGNYAQNTQTINNYASQNYGMQSNYSQPNNFAQQNNDYRQNNNFVVPTGYAQPNNGYAQQGGQSNGYAQPSGMYGGEQERPMVFKLEQVPDGYIYEYSDRLEYYRYTGAGMLLINAVSKKR